MNKIIITWLLLIPILAQGQMDSVSATEPSKIWNVELGASYDFPWSSMAVRFGNGFRLGGGIKVKTKNQWIFGGQFHFIVGGKIKEPGLLLNMATSTGYLVTQFGEQIKIEAFQRGYMFGLHAGKNIPINPQNPNSGITLQTGLGFMQHKINLFDRDNVIPGLKGDLKKGYDRLANGLYIKQYAGYTFYSPKKLVNFTVGLDIVYGMTAGRRAYLYDVEKPGTDSRNDILTGISASWLIPLYKKNVEETYY